MLAGALPNLDQLCPVCPVCPVCPASLESISLISFTRSVQQASEAHEELVKQTEVVLIGQFLLPQFLQLADLGVQGLGGPGHWPPGLPRPPGLQGPPSLPGPQQVQPLGGRAPHLPGGRLVGGKYTGEKSLDQLTLSKINKIRQFSSDQYHKCRMKTLRCQIISAQELEKLSLLD